MRYFSWHLEQKGPDHQKVHYAAAKREPLSQSDNWALSSSCTVHGQIIGSGSGLTTGNAKQLAAAQALQYLTSLPPGNPLFSLQ
jgi:dsRNA-specific ribonuclease